METGKNGPGIRKLYYSIGEVSELTGVPAHVLRYWESEFTQLHPKKGRTGNRLFQDKDIQVVTQIKELLYEKRYTIAGAKAVLDPRKKHETNGAGEDLLGDVQEGLKEILAIINNRSGRGAAR